MSCCFLAVAGASAGISAVLYRPRRSGSCGGNPAILDSLFAPAVGAVVVSGFSHTAMDRRRNAGGDGRRLVRSDDPTKRGNGQIFRLIVHSLARCAAQHSLRCRLSHVDRSPCHDHRNSRTLLWLCHVAVLPAPPARYRTRYGKGSDAIYMGVDSHRTVSFSFVFLKFVNSGYLLILSPPLFAWLGGWMEDWYTQPGAKAEKPCFPALCSG